MIPSLDDIRSRLAAFPARDLGEPWRFLKAASVLVPILPRPEGPSLLFTKRAAHLRHHRGQISFPGGRRDTQDKDALATAIRETQEELGLLPDVYTILGRLDETPVTTAYRLTPFVALLDPAAVWRPSPAEVARVFEVPLEAFCDERRHRVEGREAFGLPLAIHYYDVWEEPIWGATGRVVAQFLEVVRGRLDRESAAR